MLDTHEQSRDLARTALRMAPGKTRLRPKASFPTHEAMGLSVGRLCESLACVPVTRHWSKGGMTGKAKRYRGGISVARAMDLAPSAAWGISLRPVHDPSTQQCTLT